VGAAQVTNVDRIERSWRSPRQQNPAKQKQGPHSTKRRVARSRLHADLWRWQRPWSEER